MPRVFHGVSESTEPLTDGGLMTAKHLRDFDLRLPEFVELANGRDFIAAQVRAIGYAIRRRQ